MYEWELDPVRKFLAQHPGLSTNKLAKAIRSLPWPEWPADGVYDSRPGRFEGTRLAAPALSGLEWKLRYLELMGDARQERGRWYINT